MSDGEFLVGVRTLNEFVRWVDKVPHLAPAEEELTRIEFYADLQRLLEENSSILGLSPYESAVQKDKRQLASYYVLDWILRKSDRPFSLADAVEAASALSSKLVGASAMAEPVSRLVAALLEWSYVERVDTLGDAQVVDANKPSTDRYRLTEVALIALAGIRRPEQPPFSRQFTNPSEERFVGADQPALGANIDGYQILSVFRDGWIWGSLPRPANR